MNAIKVLVVDDEPLNLEILNEYLTEAGYEARGVSDGMEALGVLQAEPQAYSAVLLDKMMPGLDGFEVLKKIRSDNGLDGLPVIMQTAADNREDILLGLQEGAFHYLTKPFDKDVLLSVISTAVREWSYYQKLRLELAHSNGCLQHMQKAEFTFHALDDGLSLAVFIATACPEPSRVVVGLSELLINAVEHGNAGISYQEKESLMRDEQWQTEVTARLNNDENKGKQVQVSFLRNPDTIKISIKDAGEGFAWDTASFSLDDVSTRTHGRGIALAKALSFSRIEYVGKGNEVHCWVDLSD